MWAPLCHLLGGCVLGPRVPPRRAFPTNGAWIIHILDALSHGGHVLLFSIVSLSSSSYAERCDVRKLVVFGFFDCRNGKIFRAAMQCIWVLTFHGRYAMLPLFFLRSGRWQWGVLLGRSVAQRVREVGRSAVCKVRLIFGLYNRAHAFSDYNSGIIG